jgi:outer membrane protein assembly factor BamA
MFMTNSKFAQRLSLTVILLALVAVQSTAQSRLVEDIEIRGYRTVRKEEILKRLRTKAGKPFSLERANRDFGRVMKMGVFDRLKSKLVVEDGPRGGKVVVFVLEEVPKEK